LQGLTTVDVQTGGALIDTQAYNVTVAQNLVHDTSSGAPATDGGLTKLGAGILTLSGANTYTGATAVNAGTLLAANTSGSATGTGAVSVNSGGTLGGNGTISGGVTVASGGTLAPGALAVSRLTLGSTLALQSGSTLAITLGGTTVGSYDQVLVSGTLTLAGTLNVSTVNGFALAPNETFIILDNTSNTALTSGLFTNTIGTLYTDAAGQTFSINYVADTDGGQVPNDVTLTYLGTNVVPEPSTWACLLVCAAGLGQTLRQRRRWLAPRAV
jgi:autotransporter-associated beta strand protein